MPPRLQRLLLIAIGSVCWSLTGCGTTKNSTATEQLVLSDAVDTTVARLDFTPLEGQKVFFDTQFIKDYKGIGFVNSDYVVGSVRQQMVAAGVLLQKTEDSADFIVEGRIGVLGTDSHEVIYGLPATSTLNDAANAIASISQVPKVPGIPELALAKRSNQVAAAKLAVFAYEKESRDRVWQSGLILSRSNAKDLWLFGAGPFQRGTVYEGKVRFAGTKLNVPLLGSARPGVSGPIASYREGRVFNVPADKVEEIQQASGEVTEGNAK